MCYKFCIKRSSIESLTETSSFNLIELHKALDAIKQKKFDTSCKKPVLKAHP